MGCVGTAVIPSNWARPQTKHRHATVRLSLCSSCTCVRMCTALDVRTQVVEYWVAIKCRDESRHVNYGQPDTLPMTCQEDPLGLRNL